MAWFDSNWEYRKQIVIDADQVSATLSNFTVLVSVTDTDLRDNAQADGDDILFTSDDEVTQLSHEIESYDNSTGTLVAHVKVPSLSGSVDTVLYIYFGNAGAANQEDITNTWDVNFITVWHLNQDPGGTAPQILDSTGNNNDGTSNGTMTSDDLVAAQIGNGIDFDGTDDAIVGPDLSTAIGSGDITVSFWVKHADISSDRYMTYIGAPTTTADNWSIYAASSDSTFRLFSRDGTSGNAEITTGTIATDTWYHLHATRSGTTGTFYLNGSPFTPVTDLEFGQTFGSNTTVGAFRTQETFNTQGIIDEFRISDVARSSDWITTEYNNQNAPGTFYTVGVLETESAFTYQFMNLDMSNIGFRRSWSN